MSETVEALTHIAEEITIIEYIAPGLNDFDLAGTSMKVTWTDTLAVGNSQMDQQHRNLFKMANAVGACLDAGIHNEIVVQIFNQIILHTAEHFEQEERLLKAMDFPEYESHKKSHDNLKEKLNDYALKMQRDDGCISSDIYGFFINWLTHHILTEDSKYESHI